MPKVFPIYEQRYIELIRNADTKDRLDFALKYIDSVLELFIEYGNKPNSSSHLFMILKQGLRGWKKICRYDIVVHTDDEGYEYLIEPQTYPDYVLIRFLGVAESKSQFNAMKVSLIKIFKHLNYKYNEVGTYEQFNGIEER